MFLRKNACLFLALVFICAVSVPARADGNPPPRDGGNIHPWDNNDEYRYGSGPTEVMRRPLLFEFSFNGRLYILPVWSAPSLMKSNRISKDGVTRRNAGSLEVVTSNR